jgi:Zn-dependent metalloprotease
MMKRFLSLLFILVLLFLSSCDSPLSNTGHNQKQMAISKKAQKAIINSGTSPARADSIRKTLWQQFKSKNGKKWRIRWSKQTDLPRAIFLGLTKKAYHGTARQAARSFLADHAALLGFGSLKHLRYVRTQKYKGIRYVTFNEIVHSVPVYEAQYVVHLKRNGQVNMVNGRYYPHIKVSTSTPISKAAAIQTAQSDLKTDQNAGLKTTARLIIYRNKKKFHLAWELTLLSQNQGKNWLYMVDAHSGQILYKLNLIMDVAGTGKVYPKTKCLSPVTTKTLKGLYGNGYLDGTYAKVWNSSASRAYSATENFQYAPSSTHFDEVSLYYYIDNFRRNFINALDVHNNLFERIDAYAHHDQCPNGCYSSGSPGSLSFSDVHPYAEVDQVVYHEYGHAVIHDIKPGITSSFDEEGGISEGTPDYFAGSFTKRAVIGGCGCEGVAERDMENPQYSNYNDLPRDPQTGKVDVNPHESGEFFSSIMWNIRQKIGASSGKTNTLVYKSLHGVSDNPDFLGFRYQMVQADQEAYNGEDVSQIKSAFSAKDVYPPPSVIVTGPRQVYPGDEPIWTANPSGGKTPYQYSWYWRKKPKNSYTWTEWTHTPIYDQQTFGYSYDPDLSAIQLKVTITDADNNTATNNPPLTAEFRQPFSGPSVNSTLTDSTAHHATKMK